MSKSQTAKTFWVGISVFPIYLTCSSSGKRNTNMCAIKCSNLWKRGGGGGGTEFDISVARRPPDRHDDWQRRRPGEAIRRGDVGRRSAVAGRWRKKKKVLGDDGKKEGERHYKRLGILWLIDCDNYSLFLVIVPLLWQYGCCHKRLVVKPLLWLTEPVVTNLSDNCTFVTIIVTKVFVIY